MDSQFGFSQFNRPGTKVTKVPMWYLKRLYPHVQFHIDAYGNSVEVAADLLNREPGSVLGLNPRPLGNNEFVKFKKF